VAARLREEPGGSICVGGSPSLVRSLLEAGPLDELTLMISPVVPGGGRKRLASRFGMADSARHLLPERGSVFFG